MCKVLVESRMRAALLSQRDALIDGTPPKLRSLDHRHRSRVALDDYFHPAPDLLQNRPEVLRHLGLSHVKFSHIFDLYLFLVSPASDENTPVRTG